jgi:CubicO group peptidase (beta-lactamase class C family)
MARFHDKPLEFQPGEKWNIADSGYVVLTAVVEKVVGMPYEKFLQDQILTPVGLKDTGYDSAPNIRPPASFTIAPPDICSMPTTRSKTPGSSI